MDNQVLNILLGGLCLIGILCVWLHFVTLKTPPPAKPDCFAQLKIKRTSDILTIENAYAAEKHAATIRLLHAREEALDYARNEIKKDEW